MTRIAFLPLLLALALESAPQDRLGIGFAMVEVSAGVRLDLFDSASATESVATIEIVERNGDLVIAPASDWLRPETLWLDYSLFVFRVVTVSGDAYEVVVNEGRGGRSGSCPQRAVEFRPRASTFLVEDVTGLNRLSPATDPLRATPALNAETIPYAAEADGWDCLAVAEVRGAWVRVKLSDLCTHGGAEPVDGWVRWRDGDRLLIGYGLTC